MTHLPPAAFDEALWDVPETLAYLHARSYKRVALQLPDHLLLNAPALAAAIQKGLNTDSKVYVLGDTTYNPLAVDEVAAQHMAAQCVVHYGHASMSAVASLPAFFVFPKTPIDVKAVAAALFKSIPPQPAVSSAPCIASPSQHSNDTSSQTEAGVTHAIPVSSSCNGESKVHNSSSNLNGPDGTGSGHCSGEQNTGAGSLQQPVVVLLVEQVYHHAITALKEALDSLYQGGCPILIASPSARALDPPSCNQSTSLTTPAQNVLPSQPPQCVSSGAVVTAPQIDTLSETSPCCRSSSRPACCGGNSAQGVTDSDPTSYLTITTTSATTSPDNQSTPPSSFEVSSQATSSPQLQSEGQQSQGCSYRSYSLAGLNWSLSESESKAGSDEDGGSKQDTAGPTFVWLGSNEAPTLPALQLSLQNVNGRPCSWICLDPESGVVESGVARATTLMLKRRYYLVEKAKDANIIGILVGTLATAGFLEVIQRIRVLATAAGKKTYTFLMGKPNPAKLANFPEVEIFVMVADPLGMLMDSKEYLAPLITPWEAALAFTGQSLGPQYSFDFRDVMEVCAPSTEDDESAAGESDTSSGLEGMQLATRAVHQLGLSVNAKEGSGRQVTVRSAAQFLTTQRTYTGLETPLTGAIRKEVVLAVTGRGGRAAGYVGEGDLP